jgi:hypothetical protein
MSVQPPPEDLEGYCDVSDVSFFFEKMDIDVSSNPTQKHVEDRIKAESNWIDEYTNHAWRERTVENEYHDFTDTYYWRAGMPIKLQKRDIRQFDESKGDKIEFLEGGGNYTDWVSNSSYKEGRDEDYWLDASQGLLHVYRRNIFFKRYKEMRVTYRYGKQRVPQTIRDVCAQRTAAWLMEAQQYRITTPGNENAPDPQSVAQTWREDAERRLEPFVEVRSIGTR